MIDSSLDTLNLDLNADGSSSIQITGQASDSATLAVSTRNQLASAATNLAIQSEQTILQIF